MRELHDEMRKFLLGYLRARGGPAPAQELQAVCKEVFAPLGRKGALGKTRKNPHPREVQEELDHLLAQFVEEGKAVLGFSIHPDHERC